MKTIEIIKAANENADENESNTTVISFLNDAMARINVFMNAGFPYLTLLADDTPAFSEKWQRTLLIPFAMGRIKQKDSSQFEYTDAYGEFLNAMYDFKQKYKVPTKYRVLEEGVIITLPDESLYEVEPDDTLYAIADRYGFTVADIIAVNDTIYYKEDGIASDIYDQMPLPQFRAF